MADTAPSPDARTYTASRFNLRDVGGLPVPGGEVRSGLVLRSGEPVELADDDAAALARLAPRLVVDLRTDHERDERPAALPAGTATVHLDVMGPDAPAGPARLRELFTDVEGARRQLGEGRAVGFFAETYRRLVTDARSREAYASLLRLVADAEGPVLFHCTAGKDRTGWAAALVQGLLGVDEETVLADYLRTNELFAASYAGYRDTYAAAGGDPDVLDAALLADERYLAAALEEVHAAHGSLEEYAVAGLGLGPEELARLRSRLVAPVGAAPAGTA